MIICAILYHTMKKRLTIEIDEELKKALKIEAAKKGITLKEALERLIKVFLFAPEV
jgi:predicted DNA binding CopG/RHH family protein